MSSTWSSLVREPDIESACFWQQIESGSRKGLGLMNLHFILRDSIPFGGLEGDSLVRYALLPVETQIQLFGILCRASSLDLLDILEQE